MTGAGTLTTLVHLVVGLGTDGIQRRITMTTVAHARSVLTELSLMPHNTYLFFSHIHARRRLDKYCVCCYLTL